MAHILDQIDRRILRELMLDSSQSQRALAEKVGLSQNATWRRIRHMEELGVIEGQVARVNAEAVGLDLVVFAMIRTRQHSADWLRDFRAQVLALPEVVGFYRIGGDYDYLLKIVTENMQTYDQVYQRLIGKLTLDTVTSYFAMEAIADNRPLPIR
ncbi:Lrp/AsnC family transcriptional regulator [Xanthobacter sp. KR7-65]|uniref:Lrp/AsnC family transcriptional regulator n=1 Tax=Xanthobacter sp. KR7-65 TaxID=3156612 RepID=UPI0032B4E7D7